VHKHQEFEEARFAARGWIAIIAICLLFAPKVNLIEVPGQTAGLRVDDLVLAVLAVPLAMAYRGLERDRVCLWIAVVVALGGVSCVVGDGNVLYAARLLEYAVFLLAGRFSGLDMGRVAKVWIGTQLSVACLQELHIVGVFRDGIYLVPQQVDRAFGTTGGPWELAAVTGLASVVALATHQRHDAKRVLVHVAALAIQILAESRTGLVVQSFILCFDLVGARLGPAAVLTTCGLAIVVACEVVIADRLDTSALVAAARGLGGDEPSALHELAEVEGLANVDDLSMAVRAEKWSFTSSTWLQGGWLAILLGVGQGHFGPAVDGGWLRILCESGIIGLMAYIGFLAALRRTVASGWTVPVTRLGGEWATCLLIAFAAHMVFIDVHLSYKTMAFLLLLAGSLAACPVRPSWSTWIDRYGGVRLPAGVTRQVARGGRHFGVSEASDA